MKTKISHDWAIDAETAKEIQLQLSEKVIRKNSFSTIKHIAGADVTYSPDEDLLAAAVVVLEAKNLEIVDSSVVLTKPQFPYHPGLFSFREIPPLIEAIGKLNIEPDLFVCDGQGIAHPKRFGLASHLGVIFDVPSIGCAKSMLIGSTAQPHIQRGSVMPIISDGETIGNCLRTQQNIKPVYISVGHKIDLETSCNWILTLTPKYRLPETTRQADQLSRKALNTIKHG